MGVNHAMTIDRSKHDDMFAHITTSIDDLREKYEPTRQLVVAFGMWGATYTAYIFRGYDLIDEEALADFLYNYAQYIATSVLGVKKRGIILTTPEFRLCMDYMNELKDAAFASIEEIAHGKWQPESTSQVINRALFKYLDVFDSISSRISAHSIGFATLAQLERTFFIFYSQILRERLRGMT